MFLVPACFAVLLMDAVDMRLFTALSVHDLITTPTLYNVFGSNRPRNDVIMLLSEDNDRRVTRAGV